MLESILILAAVLAAALLAWGGSSYRRFIKTRERFLRHLEIAAPEMARGALTASGFVVQVFGVDIDVDFATLARRRLPKTSEGDSFDRIIDDIRAQMRAPAVPPYPLVADRVLPLLKPAAYVGLFERYPDALRLQSSPFAPGVDVTYVIAGPDRRTAVTLGMVRTWGVSRETLHRRAVENLRVQTRHMLAEMGGPRTRYEHIDGYDATRILIADLILPPGVAAPLLAIPEETVLLMASENGGQALATEAAARHDASARPLTKDMFVLSSVGAIPLVHTPP